jgi:hypothetical protein
MKAESRIQQDIVRWYRNTYCLKHHSPRGMIFSVPNEGQMRLSQTGLLPGVSDLVVITPSGKVVFVECKTEKGRQSDAQIEFQKRVQALGFTYILVRDLKNFQENIAIY